MSLGICVQKSCLFGFGGILLVVGVIMASCWPFIMKSVLKSQLSLTPGSRTYDMWVQTPLPMYLDIYLFNWTNSHNITAKPVLEQVGPFVFSEQHTKVKIAWNHNDSITYKQYRKWVYHPEMSNGSLSDKITNFNVIAVTIGALIKSYNLPRFEKFAINEGLKVKENLIVTRNVSQLLFEGFSDPILDILEIFKKYNFSVPVEFDKFGWFYKRNMSETADGLFTMNTGAVDITKLGDVVTWNNKTKQSFYSGDCAKVQGSLGELWSPYSAKSDLVNLYAPDICGGIPLESSGLLSLHDLSGKIFTGNRMVFDNGTAYKQYGCYCIQGKQCQPSGLRDISLCRGGAPVYLSFPHFYLADESYSSAVIGMNPVPERHSFNIALEEKTGVPLRVHARLQINLLVEKIEGLDFYTVPHMYMPMIWFDQRAEMTEKVAHDLKPLSVLAIYGIWVLVVLALIGTILVLAGVYLKLNNFWDSEIAPSQSETLLTDDDH